MTAPWIGWLRLARWHLVGVGVGVSLAVYVATVAAFVLVDGGARGLSVGAAARSVPTLLLRAEPVVAASVSGPFAVGALGTDRPEDGAVQGVVTSLAVSALIFGFSTATFLVFVPRPPTAVAGTGPLATFAGVGALVIVEVGFALVLVSVGAVAGGMGSAARSLW